MPSKDIVSGVGARYAEIFPLDSNGLPLPATSTAVPMQGSIVQGIKTFAYTDPEPQRITHYGDDNPFAQDSLPPTDVGSFVITTAKTNLVIDAMLENLNIVTQNNAERKLVNSNNKGSEPQGAISVYRQALDTQKSSATFGKLRQYHYAFIPSTRITPASQSMEQGATDKTYRGTPTPVTSTPWGQAFDSTTWGATQGEYIENIVTYKPRWNFYRGNGTLVAFQLSKPPVSSSDINVFVNGTLTAPSAVNVTVANPAFTMGSAPANGVLVAAEIFHNQPD